METFSLNEGKIFRCSAHIFYCIEGNGPGDKCVIVKNTSMLQNNIIDVYNLCKDRVYATVIDIQGSFVQVLHLCT